MATRDSDLPVRQGGIDGAIAYLLGLAVTLLVGSLGLNGTVELLLQSDLVEGTVLGYTFFHQWVPVLGGGMESFLVWAIVPIVVCVVSGYWIASQSPRGTGVGHGATITVGYFVLTLLGFVYLEVVADALPATIDGGLDLVIAIAITGLLFPVVFGGLGGLLADWL